MTTPLDRKTYLLQCLEEECAEVIHRISKAIRFTLEEIQPGQDKTNERRIAEELTDLLAVVQLLEAEGVFDAEKTGMFAWSSIVAKKAKIEKFYQYSIERGTAAPVSQPSSLNPQPS